MSDVPLPSFTYTYPFGFDDLTKPTKKQSSTSFIYKKNCMFQINCLPLSRPNLKLEFSDNGRNVCDCHRNIHTDKRKELR